MPKTEVLPKKIHPQSMIRLKGILAILPIGKTQWFRGIKEGRYPAPVKLGPNTTVWRAADILKLVEKGIPSAGISESMSRALAARRAKRDD